MHKRIVAVYCCIALAFTACMLRVYQINASSGAVAAAGSTGSYALDVASARGVIYDRNMERLVNRGNKYIGAVLPTMQAAAALLDREEDAARREALLNRLSGQEPFVLGFSSDDIYADGVDIFRVPERYSDYPEQVAPHVVGYLSGDGERGVSGIEKAYDQYLTDSGTRIKMRYATDAMGQIMKGGGGVGVERDGQEDIRGGVVLTIDSRIQRIVQKAMTEGCDKGAAVVLDVVGGDVLAMMSLPDFDQNDIIASFDSPDAPFINRAVSGYNIGSAFKLVVATAALESGVPVSHRHVCNGYEDIGGVIFRCNFNAVHGDIDMEEALQVSCNTYFITLAQEMSPEYLLSVARNMGFGSMPELAPGIDTQPGNLPGAAELANPAGYANFSFGQGSSLATPLQMAQAVASIANSGMSLTPRLVKGLTLDGSTLAEPTPIYSPNQILRESTARTMARLMTSVVEDGSGRTAKPFRGGAGGKTSSAQTGLYKDGKETVHAWFVGFYPAEKPRYSIAVFVEGGESGEQAAAPIFRRIADGLAGLSVKIE
jgi:penicillin-binding protein 2